MAASGLKRAAAAALLVVRIVAVVVAFGWLIWAMLAYGPEPGPF